MAQNVCVPMNKAVVGSIPGHDYPEKLRESGLTNTNNTTFGETAIE